MTRDEAAKQLNRHRTDIAKIRNKMRKIQASIAPQPVTDYTFATLNGPVKLSKLFGSKKDLIVIHNMGTGCAYCTLWADGYNGVYPHLADRAAFVVVSPDTPAVQAKFAKRRGWRFPMASHQGNSYAADLGYSSAAGGYRPGISVFKKVGKRVVRVAEADSRPGDDYCAVWHLFDLLPDGVSGWRPKFNYPT